MSHVFSTRMGAVVLTALALYMPPAVRAESAPPDSTAEWARFVIHQGDTLWVAEAMQMPGILFTGTVGKVF